MEAMKDPEETYRLRGELMSDTGNLAPPPGPATGDATAVAAPPNPKTRTAMPPPRPYHRPSGGR